MFVVHYTYCTELCTVLLLLVRGNESTVVLSLQGLLEKGGGGAWHPNWLKEELLQPEIGETHHGGTGHSFRPASSLFSMTFLRA